VLLAAAVVLLVLVALERRTLSLVQQPIMPVVVVVLVVLVVVVLVLIVLVVLVVLVAEAMVVVKQ
jgi:hypothetical protein